MLRNVSTAEARQNLGKILDAVNQRGEQYIIERQGKPMAALVPVYMIEQRQIAKERVFELMSEVHARTAEEDADKLEQLIAQEAAVVRRKRSRRIRTARRTKGRTSRQ